MATKKTTPTVFISSTSEDLEDYRKAARDAATAEGFVTTMMEYWPASGKRPPLATCLAKVADADVVVAIVAHRYGWVPDEDTADEKSITWLECEHAANDSKEILAFLVDEKHDDWPIKLREAYRLAAAAEDGTFTPELAQQVQRNIAKLKAFKNWLNSLGVRATFTNPENLRREIEGALRNWQTFRKPKQPRPKRARKKAVKKSAPDLKLFISYRRDDTQAWAGRLCDHIERGLRPEQIFMDIDMDPGVDFVEELEAAVESCDVLLAVIGPRWLKATDEEGRRRLDNEQDWVRLEIATALRRNVRVIPCLVEGTRMPRVAELPEELAGLARRQAFPISHERFNSDAERLIGAIAKIPGRNASAPRSKPAEPAFIPARTIKQNPEDRLEYVWIPHGTFWMGALDRDEDANQNEMPRHKVTITTGFWLSQAPVTVAAFRRCVAEIGGPIPEAPEFNPDWEKEDHPIVGVTWEAAAAYCSWAGGRLPSEAEWEYAARGGQEGLKYPWGNEIGERDAKYASSDGTAPVGSYPANGFGLRDMVGNAWESCVDRYAKDYYGNSPWENPLGPDVGESRVVRGGCWNSIHRYLRCSNRNSNVPDDRNNNIGFRCVRDAKRRRA